MTIVRRIETFLTPRDAERFSHLSRTELERLARRGLLTHYRTSGGHRRYALSELQTAKKRRRQSLARSGEGLSDD